MSSVSAPGVPMRIRSRPPDPPHHPPPLAAVVVVCMLVLGAAGPAAAADLPARTPWTATVDGQNVERTSRSDPIRMDAAGPVEVTLRVENRSSETIQVPFVRFHGTVLGLTFYAYTTRIDMEVPPRGAEERTFPVDLLDLGSQASGLIPSEVSLLDETGAVMAAKDMTVDVRGRISSVYGLFGMAIAALTLLLLVSVLWRLAKGTLSPNRWRRGMAVAAPGLGLGFVLTFSLSALRIASPEAGLWSTLLLGGLLIGFVAGYLSPTPTEAEAGAEPADGTAAPEDVFREVIPEEPAFEDAAVPVPRTWDDPATGPVRLVPSVPAAEPPPGDVSSQGRPAWPG
jgi:hypothetical protein